MTNETFAMPRRAFHDDKTGRELWQVTDGEFECVAPYMDVRAWTGDDRFLIFMSNRSGSWQPYRLELNTGEAKRLLKRDLYASYRSAALDPTHGELYCQDGNRIVAVHIETLEARVAVDYTGRLGPAGDLGPFKGCAGALSSDGTLIATAAATASGWHGILVAPTDGSNQFEELTLPDDIRADHTLFCPEHNKYLSFAGCPDRQNNPDETPLHRARELRIERDSGRIKPLVLVPPGFRATHSTWGASGERIYFHRKTVPTWIPTALCSVNRDGEDLQVYYETSKWKLGHSASSSDEKWIVTDSQDVDENILMLVSTQRDEQHMLCWPNMSQGGSKRPHRRSPHLPPHTDTDTHPGFSSTGRYIHYTSDISGRSQIYVVPVGDTVTDGASH